MKIEKLPHTCQWVLVKSWDIEPGAHQVVLAPDVLGLYRVQFRAAPNALGVTKMFREDTWYVQPMAHTLYMGPGDVFRRVLVAGQRGVLVVERLDAPDDFGQYYRDSSSEVE